MAPAIVRPHGVVRRIMAMTSTMITMISIRTRWGTWSASTNAFRKITRIWGLEAVAGIMEVTGEASTSPGAEEATTSGEAGELGAAAAEDC